mgnify:FL=1
MKDRILEVLTKLVACESISSTPKEPSASVYVNDFIKQIPYFQEHPELCGAYEIPNDPFGRTVPYALVLGKSPNTVILSGHIDVVSTEVYGDAEPLAFTLGPELEAKLATKDLNEVQRKDLESGEWLWGRGAADMKGGIAIAMVLLEKYAKLAQEGKLEGSYLFSAVADEECYSAGMRAIMPKYLELKNKYSLNFKLLIDPEPASEDGPAQVLSLGSIGKTMPVIMTQGAVAHIGHCYNGMSSLNMLAGIYQRTGGSLEFVDVYKDESSMPLNWQYMRDIKETYDVSLPFRSSGYMTVLSFKTTISETLAKLKKICVEVFDEEVNKLNAQYQEFKKHNRFETKEKIYYPNCVYTVSELCDKLREKDGAAFDEFYNKLYDQAKDMVAKGKSYPDATIYLMDKLLSYADIKQPVVLIGMAPPYYPATHSDQIEGREGYGSKVFEFAKKLSEEKFGQALTSEHYFTGISDNSYTSIPDLDFDEITANYPMWGSAYSLDFEAIKEISVPSILFGPIGREYHQWSERVNKRSLFEVMPEMIQSVIEFAWEN